MMWTRPIGYGAARATSCAGPAIMRPPGIPPRIAAFDRIAHRATVPRGITRRSSGAPAGPKTRDGLKIGAQDVDRSGDRVRAPLAEHAQPSWIWADPAPSYWWRMTRAS